MLQISVNGLTHRAASTPKKWGELLNSFEGGDGMTRQVVTAVRFGGVAPTFREPSALDQPLGGIEVIDVETCTVDELLLTSARAAGASIVPLKNAIKRIAAGLRTGDEVAAGRDLPALVRSVQTLTTVTAGLSTALPCDEPQRGDFDALVLRLCRIVDEVVTHQASARWPLAVEALERELMPTLDAWVLVARRVWHIS